MAQCNGESHDTEVVEPFVSARFVARSSWQTKEVCTYRPLVIL